MADMSEHDLNVALAAGADIVTERDFVLLLISLYRDCPVLWKVKSKDYKDQNKRSIALKNITKSLRVYKPTYTEDLLKKKINTLRTNFNKEKTKIDRAKRSGTSADDVPKPTLWYYNEMLFLSDQVSISDTESSEPSPSQQKEMPPKKTKKTPTDNLVDLATNYFKRPASDMDVIAKGWAIKLNRLAPDQRRYAEKIINDVLFEGEMGTLTRNGVSFPSASSPSNYIENSLGFHSSPSPNSSHATYRSPTPNQYPETLSQTPYQSPMPCQSPTPQQSPMSYQSLPSHQSLIQYQPPASQQSPVSCQSSAPLQQITILSSQTIRAPNANPNETPNETPVLIHVVEQSSNEYNEDETQSAANFLKNYSSF